MKITLFVEGGGNTDGLKADLRKGFKLFFEKAGLEGRLPKVVACGSRDNAFKQFKAEFFRKKSSQVVVLLVDSEETVKGKTVWEHLKKRDKWDKPLDAEDDQAHLMVQVMEAWFLADQKVLAEYFGKGFNLSKLPKNPNLNVEIIDKKKINEILENATKDSSKGSYEKGKHSFEILGIISPEKVLRASIHAEKLIFSLNKFSN